MKNILSQFVWEVGSINDNIRKILIERNISYYNDLSGNILLSGSNRKVYASTEDYRNYTVYVE